MKFIRFGEGVGSGYPDRRRKEQPELRGPVLAKPAGDLPPEQELSLAELTGEAERIAANLEKTGHYLARTVMRELVRRLQVPQAPDARSVDKTSLAAAWPDEFASLVAQLEESAKTYGYWNTLRDTDEATIEYWRNRTADLRARVLAAITANAGPAPAPERAGFDPAQYR